MIAEYPYAAWLVTTDDGTRSVVAARDAGEAAVLASEAFRFRAVAVVRVARYVVAPKHDYLVDDGMHWDSPPRHNAGCACDFCVSREGRR